VKNSREIMEILEAYDLTGSYRAAAELTGVDHHTVARYVKMRAAGQRPDQRRHRARAIDDYLPKIEELVVRSHGQDPCGRGAQEDRRDGLRWRGTHHPPHRCRSESPVQGRTATGL
jgi:hypothetical protein